MCYVFLFVVMFCSVLYVFVVVFCLVFVCVFVLLCCCVVLFCLSVVLCDLDSVVLCLFLVCWSVLCSVVILCLWCVSERDKVLVLFLCVFVLMNVWRGVLRLMIGFWVCVGVMLWLMVLRMLRRFCV